MKVLIVDDEEYARREMAQMLAAHSYVTVVGEAVNVHTALALTDLYRPDVVLLDVQLVGETGFDYIQQLPEPGPQIIFVTAHRQFAVQGFEHNALDYLLKPVEPKRLAEALRRTGQRRMIRPQAAQDDSVLIESGDRTRLVPWSQLEYIEADGSHTLVHLADGEALQVPRSLRDWLEICPADRFMPIHRGTLVRIAAVRELRSLGGKSYEVVIDGGTRLAVSRQHLDALRAAAGFL